jgi:hypothetical protein
MCAISEEAAPVILDSAGSSNSRKHELVARSILDSAVILRSGAITPLKLEDGEDEDVLPTLYVLKKITNILTVGSRSPRSPSSTLFYSCSLGETDNCRF